MQNLISNAIKYDGENRWARISAQTSAEKQGKEVRITVEDRGLGIESADIPHIFEPFYRGHEAVATQIKGSGVGLSLVKQIVDAHGGKISVKSTPGTGSVFTLHLPTTVQAVGCLVSSDAPKGLRLTAQGCRALTATLGTENAVFLNRNAVVPFCQGRNPQGRRNRVAVEESKSFCFPRVAVKARQPWAVRRSPFGASEKILGRQEVMTQRILLVEDEPGLVMTLSDRLTSEGYTVEMAGDAETGLTRSTNETFDLIILDVMLPGGNGFDVCRDLRQRGIRTPIIMLTARGQMLDKVLGLKIGADDYITKPFEMMELLARVEVQLRRASKAATNTPEAYQFGDVRVDFRRAEAYRGEQSHQSFPPKSSNFCVT